MIRFIYNPFSGRNRRRPGLLDFLKSRAAQSGQDFEVRVTEAPGHACLLARESVDLGHSLVVAVGGDGTLNECAQGLVHSNTAFGLVPCGSGNGLALHLGIPTEPSEALHLLLNSHSTRARIDAGEANGHLFFNAMGLGLDAEISRRFNRLVKRGLQAYVHTTLSCLRDFRPFEVSVTTRNAPRDHLRAVLTAVANSDQYGNNAYIAPGARVDDGLLDLTLVRPPGLPGMACLAYGLFHGDIHRSQHVRSLRSDSFLIERGQAGPIHTDGEVHETGARIVVRVMPRALTIIVPKTAPLSSSSHG